MINWLEWIGVIPLLGLTGNWRGYRMGGKAIGDHNMSTDIKKKFEAARASGNMDQARAMADKAQEIKDARKAEKSKSGVSQEDPKNDVLTLTDYRKKGGNAYMVPVSVEGSSIVRGKFENGISDDYARSFAGKANTVSIDLSKSKDGWYEYQEGARASRNVYRGYIKIENGKIVDEIPSDKNFSVSKQSFLSKVSPVLGLPTLNGSSKQVSWAESIREKAIRSGKITDAQAAAQTDSRWWIDNRSKL